MNPLLQYVKESMQNLSKTLVPVRDGGKQPINVVPIDALREESDDAEKRSGIRAKLLEHGGGERKLDRGREALVMLRLQHTRSTSLPLPGQPAVSHLF
jgi:hypothetical protein